jgi:hypothetical protein
MGKRDAELPGGARDPASTIIVFNPIGIGALMIAVTQPNNHLLKTRSAGKLAG